MSRNIKHSICAIALILAGCSNDPQPEQAPGITLTQTPHTITGENIYNSNCASCHGPAGDMGAGGARNLQVCLLDSTGIANQVKKGGNGMPSFTKRITDSELNKLIPYVIALRRK